MKRSITFDRDGLTLVGDLFAPEGFDETDHYPAVIVEGSFTSVKEQMPRTYAAKFAERGSSHSLSTTATDGCAFPDEAKKLYTQLQSEKELVWADGTHFDYCDARAQIDNAVANVTRFFRTHLTA
jgi:hypothetical protein